MTLVGVGASEINNPQSAISNLNSHGVTRIVPCTSGKIDAGFQTSAPFSVPVNGRAQYSADVFTRTGLNPSVVLDSNVAPPTSSCTRNQTSSPTSWFVVREPGAVELFSVTMPPTRARPGKFGSLVTHVTSPSNSTRPVVLSRLKRK